MVEGPPDSEPEDETRPEDGPILSPEELDISDDEHVTQLDEGRFVVSPSSSPDPPASETQSSSRQQPSNPTSEPDPSDRSDPVRTDQQSPPTPEPEPEQGELTQQTVHEWLRKDFAENDSRYAFDVTATFDEQVSQRRMASNDVVTIFESLMLWYAQQVDKDTPVEEILGILLMESNVPVRYPPKSVHNLVKSSNLSPDDTIADLLKAVKDEDGIQL